MVRSSHSNSPPTRRSILIAFAVICASGVGRVSARAAEASEAEGLLAEIRKGFTLRGKPIPSEIFRDFGDGNLADSASIWTSVDLDAVVGSNQYFDAIKRAGAWVSQGRAAAKGASSEATAYRYIGATKNGLLVAVATWNGGGSGVFTTLHILDLAATRASDDEGKIYTRLSLANLRGVALGDRWDGDVTISGNQIRITTKSGGGNPPSNLVAERP